MPKPHPDEEITAEYRDYMQRLAVGLDNIFNPGREKKVCFVLLQAEFGKEGRCNYISNGERKDIICLLKEILARFEGQPEIAGRA